MRLETKGHYHRKTRPRNREIILRINNRYKRGDKNKREDIKKREK